MRHTDVLLRAGVLLSLVLLLCMQGLAQPARGYDRERLEKLRQDPAMKYERRTPETQKVQPRRDTAPDRNQNMNLNPRLPRLSPPAAGFSAGGGAFLQVIFWGALAALILFIVWQMSGIRFKAGKARKDAAEASPDDVPDVVEDIHLLPYEDLIRQAIAAGNYRLAVRLYYLRALKMLTDKQFIRWEREKTNHEYLRELSGNPLRGQFGSVTRIFEYVWYGEFDLDAGRFQEVQTVFGGFERDIQGQRSGGGQS